MTVFCCGTKNGKDCKNYGGVKLPENYSDDASQIEVCDPGASWIRDVDLDMMSLIGVDL